MTHGHFDHILAAEELRRAYQIPVIAYEKEREILEDPRGNLSRMWGVAYTLKADRFVTDGEVLELAGFPSVSCTRRGIRWAAAAIICRRRGSS